MELYRVIVEVDNEIGGVLVTSSNKTEARLRALSLLYQAQVNEETIALMAYKTFRPRGVVNLKLVSTIVANLNGVDCVVEHSIPTRAKEFINRIPTAHEMFVVDAQEFTDPTNYD